MFSNIILLLFVLGGGGGKFWERKEINLPMVSDAQIYSMPGCLVYEA